GAHRLRVRYRSRQVQRHPGGRRDRDHRAGREAARLSHGYGALCGAPRTARKEDPHMSNERQARLADRIRVLIAERLEKGLRDPRLGFVTITDVRVTGDLQHASVFYTVLGDEKERTDTADALK